MADRQQLSSAPKKPSTLPKDFGGNPEEPPSYTEATQLTQHVQEGPGDLRSSTDNGPKVLGFKLEEPQVPATSRKMKKLLDGDNIIKIYSCSPGRQNVAIAEAESDLFEYFSGNAIDWTNSTLGVCDDSVSIYLVDWMKAGGKMPTEGPSSVAYRERDLDWLEQLYTIAGNLWMRKLMKQTAKDIDRFNGDDKKMQSLIAERQRRESIIKKAVQQQTDAAREATRQKTWLTKHLTKEQKTSMDLKRLDPSDQEARVVIAETHQRKKTERSLAKQRKEANKQMAKQQRQMERALTEQFRKNHFAALMLSCKRVIGNMGYKAFKLVGALVEFGFLFVGGGLLTLAKLAFWFGKCLSLGALYVVGAVLYFIPGLIFWVIYEILSASDW